MKTLIILGGALAMVGFFLNGQYTMVMVTGVLTGLVATLA